MILHAIAVIIAIVGTIILAAMGEQEAVDQLKFFLFCMALSALILWGMFVLFFG